MAFERGSIFSVQNSLKNAKTQKHRAWGQKLKNKILRTFWSSKHLQLHANVHI